MENKFEETNEILNDLVEINNDRIEGYEKAIEDLEKDKASYAPLFEELIAQSEKFKVTLSQRILQQSGEVEADDETTNSGKLYRFWMDLKTTFTGKSAKSVLQLCEFGEDAAQKAYKEALESDATMDPDVRNLISSQKAELKTAHDRIKQLRDQQKN